MGPKPIEISVIIPCRNPGRHFRDLFESLVKQQFDNLWEVIVVNNGITDDALSVAKSFSDRLNVKVIDALKKANASYARNAGVRAASAENLLFVDADDELQPGYVAAMATALESHNFVTSRIDSKTLNPQWAYEAQSPPWQETKTEVAFDFLPATGINVGIRRSLFEAVEGFPENYSGSQDIAFSWKVQLMTGNPIYFASDAVYQYRHRESLRDMYRQSCNWGFSNVLLYREFREHGMPGKPLRSAFWDWKEAAMQLLKARSKRDLASQVVRLGYCVGRLKGSIRYQVAYL